MAGYKRPRLIEFRDALPISSVGKVLRRVLRFIFQPAAAIRWETSMPKPDMDGRARSGWRQGPLSLIGTAGLAAQIGQMVFHDDGLHVNNGGIVGPPIACQLDETCRSDWLLSPIRLLPWPGRSD